ncbi:hypothetical protein CaCOL14_008351 [Colletotrichum acutatum]
MLVAMLRLALVMKLPAVSLLMVNVARTGRPARALRLAIAALLVATVASHLTTAMPVATHHSVPAAQLLEASPRMEPAVRTAKHARVQPLEIVARLAGSVVNLPITAMLVATPPLEPVMRAPQASQPMEIAVRRMARLAKVQPLVTAALLMVTAEKALTIVAMAASCLTAFALESQVMQFAARKTARLALDLVLETAAQVEAIAEALALTVARDARKIHRAAVSQPISRLLMALAALAREVSHVLVGLLMASVVALQGFVERALRIAELAANLALDAAPRRRKEFACFAISKITK